MAEIVEIGPFVKYGRAGAQYLLETAGQSALYESLPDAMRAAGDSHTAATVAIEGEQRRV